jgi:hypothetical protein
MNNKMIQHLMNRSIKLLSVIVIVMRLYCFWLLHLNYHGPCNEVVHFDTVYVFLTSI